MIYLKRPTIKIEVYDCSSDRRMWNIFKTQHYLTAKLNGASNCFLACWNGMPVGFNAILSFPSGTLKNAYRGHRLVVLPDYQGLGIGNTLSEFVGERLIQQGKRYFCKTANIKLGEYRNNSLLWRATASNMKKAGGEGYAGKSNYGNIVDESLHPRFCYTHEYIGGELIKEMTFIDNSIKLSNLDDLF